MTRYKNVNGDVVAYTAEEEAEADLLISDAKVLERAVANLRAERNRKLIDFEAFGQEIRYIHLEGDKELIRKRMKKREGHFMKTQMIDSQFQDLEKLQSDEKGITVDVEPGLDKVCERILDEINV